MQSRRDQVDAYRHQQTRLVSALVGGEPDPLDSPVRRDRSASLVGLVMGVLTIAAVVGIAVAQGPSSSDVVAAGGVVVDRATGSRYLVAAGALHPIANLTSARLLSRQDVGVSFVPHDRLARLPIGPALGIPGAPDAAPSASVLNRARWQVCAPGTQGRDVVVALTSGGVTAAMPPDSALLVTDGTVTALLWRGTRLRIPTAQVAGVLGYGAVERIRVPASWLRLVPAGPDLTAPAVPGRGERGPFVDGRTVRVGQLFRVEAAGDTVSYYVQLSDGLGALTPLDALLLQADPATTRLGPLRDLSADALAAQSVVPVTHRGAVPAAPPHLTAVPDDQVLCVRQRAPGDVELADLVVVRAPGAAAAVAGEDASTSSSSSSSAGRGVRVTVAVPAGAAALLARPGGSPMLVADTGLAYPLPRPAALGYRDADVVPGPPQLLALLPTGPALTAEAARRATSSAALVTPPATGDPATSGGVSSPAPAVQGASTAAAPDTS